MAIMDSVGNTFGNLLNGVTSGASTLADLIPILLAGLGLGAVLWLLYEDLFLYKYKIHLKRIVGKAKINFEDKAMEKRLKNGARVWKFKRLKVMKAEPPESVLIPDSKGKIHAYGYLIKDNHIIWCSDPFDVDDTDDKIKEVLKKKSSELTKEEQNLLVFNQNNQPVSTNDRIVLADAMNEADFGKKDIHKLLAQILAWTPTIVVIVLLIFGFKYYAEPISQGSVASANALNSVLETNKQVAEINKEVASLLAEIKGDYQIMKADVNSLKDEKKGKVNGSGQ